MHFKNKTVFVTGGSRGIGLEIAKKLASEGANIVIAAKTSDPHPKLPGTIHTAAAEIEAAGGKALACMVDIRDENQVLAAVKKAVEPRGWHPKLKIGFTLIALGVVLAVIGLGFVGGLSAFIGLLFTIAGLLHTY